MIKSKKREKKVAGIIKNIISLTIAAVVAPGVCFAAQQPNPRGVAGAANAGRSADEVANASVRRSATSVIARSMSQNKRQSDTVVVARPATVRSAVARPGTIARSASKASVARSGVKANVKNANVSRAGVARATAVFNDVSKISGGYSNCRDAYATCMDQMCANANDTYRRCFCSDRFSGFRDASDRIDEAVRMLADFQETNLNAVDKTAEEVSAMYSASEGEAAIKRDTSASQKLLDNISELLAGKKSSYVSKNYSAPTTVSLGVLDFSGFSSTADNAFGDSSSVFGGDTLTFSGFGNSSYTDISTLEGADLYNAAMKQCTQITREACSGDAIFNLARSSYSILVTQDCNLYEKAINAKKVSLENTIRTAEKYLREARLNEYRAHNSADVNACLTAVENAMRQPLACGADYSLCLDYTGRYINATTGEAIYGPGLFGLNDLIVLDGSADVVKANAGFGKVLDDKRKFAETALDTCRGIADTVWEEFKRQAIIKIAQAQDDKIESVKNSCVETMKNCYDTQTASLNDFAGDVQSSVKSISVLTARDQCKNKVLTCAALYGDVDGCSYDDKTKKIEAVNGKKCGLQSLLALVDAVDSVKVRKGCEESLREYAKEICTPVASDKDHTYPWNCKDKSFGAPGDYAAGRTTTLYGLLEAHAVAMCGMDIDANGKYTADQKIVADDIVKSAIERIVDDIEGNMSSMLAEECEEFGGVYGKPGMEYKTEDLLTAFYNRVFGGDISAGRTYGVCLEDTEMAKCLNWNNEGGVQYASYDKDTQKCNFTDEWFHMRCNTIGGNFANGVCVVREI
ncbi:MAG: hypothetical protein IKF41_02625 [Alphaproteobacteria bacterium]|nr:hypothetical protein [Alphaproteobacteria bacterium]